MLIVLLMTARLAAAQMPAPVAVSGFVQDQTGAVLQGATVELVGAGGVIGDRRLDRIAGVAQVDEVDAFDDAAVLDVEAGDDADLEHAALVLRMAGRAQ